MRCSGLTRSGRPCALVDNTGERLSEPDLRDILARLIDQDAFGFAPRAGADGVLRLDQPRTAHIQIGQGLYRLIVWRSEARIEPF